MSRKFVTKAKYNGTHVEIEYTEHREQGTDTLSLSSDDVPAPSFVKAQEAMKDVLIQLMKAAGIDLERDGLTVNGASFSENEKQGFGATIMAVKRSDTVKGVVVLNTPHYAIGTGEGHGAGLLTKEQAKALRRFQLEAEHYLSGKRNQQTLFDGQMAAAGDDSVPYPAEDEEPTDEDLTFNMASKITAEAPKKEKAKKAGKVRVTKRKGVKGLTEHENDYEEAA